MLRILFPAFLFAGCLLAVDPRPKATDYPSHAESDKLAIGAEYLMHSFSNGSQMYETAAYLVVDTAIYPHGALDLKRNQFSLRMTLQGSRKQPDQTVVLRPESPQLVSYSITSSFNSVPPEMRGAAGQRQPAPMPSDQNTGLDSGKPAGPEAVADVVTRMALPEDTMRSGQAGYLYFGFAGQTKKIKALDLVYGEGDAALVVKLF